MEREERKKCFIKPFMKAFAENGIDKTSIKKLAQAADMNEASIYQYFSNKDDIIIECVKQYFVTVKAETFPILTDITKPVMSKLDYILQYSEKSDKQDKFVFQVLTNPRYSMICAPILKKFQNWLVSVGEILSAQLDIPKNTMIQIVLLLYSTIINDKLFNDKEMILSQTKFLMCILKHEKACLENRRANAEPLSDERKIKIYSI